MAAKAHEVSVNRELWLALMEVSTALAEEGESLVEPVLNRPDREGKLTEKGLRVISRLLLQPGLVGHVQHPGGLLLGLFPPAVIPGRGDH